MPASFLGLEIRKIDVSYRVDVMAIGGAPASGLENPNAVTDSFKLTILGIRFFEPVQASKTLLASKYSPRPRWLANARLSSGATIRP